MESSWSGHLDVTTVTIVAVVIYGTYKYAKSKSDPYVRSNQKKQERKEKKKAMVKSGEEIQIRRNILLKSTPPLKIIKNIR